MKSLARKSIVNHLPTSRAHDSSIKKAQPDTKWEPYYRCKYAQDSELGLRDMPALLQADHLGMVWRERSGDHVAC